MNKKQEHKAKNIRNKVRIILIILTVFFCVFVGYVIVKFAMDKEFFQSWMKKHGLLGKITYCFMVVFQVVVALVPGEPLEIAGGYAFGGLQGTVLCLLSATFGSMIVFLLVRRFGTNFVEIIFSKDDIKGLGFLKAAKQLEKKKKEILMIVLFILPGTPKDLLCYFAGLTSIDTKLWFLVCSIGRLPSLLTSTIGGEALETKNYGGAVAAFGIALVISVAGIIIYRYIHRKHNQKETS